MHTHLHREVVPPAYLHYSGVKYASPTRQNLQAIEESPFNDRASSIKLSTQRSPTGIDMNEDRLKYLVKAKERRDQRMQGMINLPSVRDFANNTEIAQRTGDIYGHSEVVKTASIRHKRNSAIVP